MLCREVVKAEEHVLILFQAVASVWKFELVTVDELLIGYQSPLAGRCQVHLMDQLLGFGLNTLGHFIQNVGGFMYPAAASRFIPLLASVSSSAALRGLLGLRAGPMIKSIKEA